MAVSRLGLYGGPRTPYGNDFSAKQPFVRTGDKPTHRRYVLPMGPFVILLALWRWLGA